MATESTAIVNLLDLVKSKPMPKDDGDDALFGGRARFDPMAMPVAAAPVMLPQPFVRQPAPALDHLKTHRVTRVAAPDAVKKFALPVGLFVVTMVLLSIYLAKGDSKKAAAKVTVVHAPAPAVQMPILQPPAPPPAPVAAPAPIVTPIETSSEPATPPAIAKTEPTVTPIEPAVAAPTVPEPTVPTVPAVAEATAEAPPVAAPAQAKHHHHHAAARTTKREKRVATADAPKPAKAEKLGGKGALQLSSSPAREVWIDGRNTKQMTPQRMTLVPGTHNITLVDKKTHGAKTFQVEIKSNETTKIAKSY